MEHGSSFEYRNEFMSEFEKVIFLITDYNPKMNGKAS